MRADASIRADAQYAEILAQAVAELKRRREARVAAAEIAELGPEFEALANELELVELTQLERTRQRAEHLAIALAEAARSPGHLPGLQARLADLAVAAGWATA